MWLCFVAGASWQDHPHYWLQWPKYLKLTRCNWPCRCYQKGNHQLFPCKARPYTAGISNLCRYYCYLSVYSSCWATVELVLCCQAVMSTCVAVFAVFIHQINEIMNEIFVGTFGKCKVRNINVTESWCTGLRSTWRHHWSEV